MRRIRSWTVGLQMMGLYGVQSLKYISLQIFEVFNSKAKSNQVIPNPILEPFWLR